MSNDNQIARLWKLQTKVNMLVSDGRRDPKDVADILQGILEFPPSSWREEDGVIYSSVESDGMIGELWTPRLQSKGFRMGDIAKQVLKNPYFIPSKTGTIIEVAILRGCLFEEQNRITKKIRAFAEAFRTSDKRKLSKPNVELTCLIREKFTDKEIKAMGLRHIVAMHEPINAGGPRLLRASVGRWLSTYSDGPDDGWDLDYGFAFTVEPPVSSNVSESKQVISES